MYIDFIVKMRNADDIDCYQYATVGGVVLFEILIWILTMFVKVALIVLLLITAGCAGSKPPKATAASKSSSPVLKKLYAQYYDWKGVKYRIGGNSKKGIDCSGFVQLTYKQKFNKKVPRTTELLAKTGKKIDLKKLRPGDAVFFKTGWSVRHVGIYMGDGKFMHASTSRGVVISKLKNQYWLDAYWMSRRF